MQKRKHGIIDKRNKRNPLLLRRDNVYNNVNPCNIPRKLCYYALASLRSNNSLSTIQVMFNICHDPPRKKHTNIQRSLA